jgi:tight adherence protein B
MGLNPINATLHNPVAAVSLASGLLLLWLNRKIMSRLVTRTHVKVFNEGQDLNQLAEVTLSLQAGLPVRRILEAGVAAGVGAGVGAQVRKSLELAERNGLAALGLLRSQLTIEADQLSMTVETEVERLQLRLLVPVGLLVLPALVLLAVVPTAIALLSN